MITYEGKLLQAIICKTIIIVFFIYGIFHRRFSSMLMIYPL